MGRRRGRQEVSAGHRLLINRVLRSYGGGDGDMTGANDWTDESSFASLLFVSRSLCTPSGCSRLVKGVSLLQALLEI